MHDCEILHHALTDCCQNNETTALATVVHIEGPAYRSIGTSMVFTRSGKRFGSISAGCLEEDVWAHTQQSFADGLTRTLCYDARDENELLWGMATGCGGTITIQVEVLADDCRDDLAAFYHQVHVQQQPALLALQIVGGPTNNEQVSRIACDHRGTRVIGQAAAGEMTPEPFRQTWLSWEQRAHKRLPVQLEGPPKWLCLPCYPPPALLIVGGGSDAQPLVTLFRQLQWRVEVIDHRTALKPADPHNPSLTWCNDSAATFAARPPNRRLFHAAIIKNHHFERDANWLKVLLNQAIPYLGVLGPRSRFERLSAHLRETGFDPEPTALDRVHAPAGLDLGGETPADVALSIAAEVQKCLHDRNGLPLKQKAGSIHERDKLVSS